MILKVDLKAMTVVLDGEVRGGWTMFDKEKIQEKNNLQQSDVLYLGKDHDGSGFNDDDLFC